MANISTRTTRAREGATHTIHMDRFDKATLKLDGAMALVTAFGILASETNDEIGMPISGPVLNSAMNGIQLLIESAVDDLLATEGGAA